MYGEGKSVFCCAGGGSCYVTHQWQPGRRRREHVCSDGEGAEAERREAPEGWAPGSPRGPPRADTSPAGTPPTAPTAAAAHISGSKTEGKLNAVKHAALEQRGFIKTTALNYTFCLRL